MLRGGNDQYLAVCRDESHRLAFFASISTIPFLPNFIHNFGMGSHPFLWGLFLAPFFLASFFRLFSISRHPECSPDPQVVDGVEGSLGNRFLHSGRNDGGKNQVLKQILITVLLAFGLFYTHPSWGITSALIIFFLLPAILGFQKASPCASARGGLEKVLAKLIAFTLLLSITLLPMLSSVINMLAARANTTPLGNQWAEFDSGRFNSLKEAFLSLVNLFQLRGNLFFTFMFGLGLVLIVISVLPKRTLLCRCKGESFKKPYSLFAFVLILLALVFLFFDAGYFNFFGRFYTLTQPWGFWHRVIKYFVFPLAIFSGLGLDFLSSKASPCWRARGGLMKTCFPLTLVFFITASLIISTVDLNQYVRVFAPGRLDFKALLWAKDNLPSDAVVLNDTATDGDISLSRPVDGGAWLSVISNQKSLLGYLFQAEPDYEERYYLLNHLSELETNPQILKLLNKFKVGYIYYSDCSFVDRRHTLSLNFLQNSRNFENIYEEAGTCGNGATGKVYLFAVSNLEMK